MSATFVGTVPQSNNYVMTNSITPGLNLIGSIIPATGDISTNVVMQLTNIYKKDYVYTFDPTNGGYSQKESIVASGSAAPGAYVNSTTGAGWGIQDPIIDQVSYGFFYWNNQTFTNTWVENFTINP